MSSTPSSAQKNKVWIWAAVNHFEPGILAGRLVTTVPRPFDSFGVVVSLWQCFFSVTDGYQGYPQYIPDGGQIVSKTDRTRVEGENTRLRHDLAQLARKTLFSIQ